ncbi:MAG: hypothetical protein GY791_04700 [Alphaproteobacteria bacterium]|nr:hypothetical protein [Alphaproteobacteria bacterium]
MTHLRPLHTIKYVALAVALILAPALPSASQSLDGLLTQLQDAKDRLDLTPEQKSKVRPILVASVQEREKVLGNFGLQGDLKSAKYMTLRQKWDLIKQLHGINERTENKLRPILSSAQMRQYQEIEDEFRQQLENRITARRDR